MDSSQGNQFCKHVASLIHTLDDIRDVLMVGLEIPHRWWSRSSAVRVRRKKPPQPLALNPAIKILYESNDLDIFSASSAV